MQLVTGTEELGQHLQSKNCMHPSVNKTDKKYYTHRESKKQVKMDLYSGKITLMDEYGYPVSSKRTFSIEEINDHMGI